MTPLKIFLTAFGVLALSSAAVDAEPLRAGASAVDITPLEFPVTMPGGFTANGATSAHDPLHARALVLSDGTMTLAMVVLDTLGAGPDVLDEAKQIASEKTGLPVSYWTTGQNVPDDIEKATPQRIAELILGR